MLNVISMAILTKIIYATVNNGKIKAHQPMFYCHRKQSKAIVALLPCHGIVAS